MNVFWGNDRNRDSGRPNTPPEFKQEEEEDIPNTTTLQTIQEQDHVVVSSEEEEDIAEMSATNISLDVSKYDGSKNGSVTYEEFIRSLEAVFQLNTKWTVPEYKLPSTDESG